MTGLLEPCAVKVARTVLRGGGGSNDTSLPDLEKLSVGETVDQVLEAHPRLTAEGIYAALRFAANALRADVVYPTAGKER